MFTGLIASLGTVCSLQKHGSEIEFQIETEIKDLELGESIAVDGCCLTVSALIGNSFQCLASPETFEKTIAGKYQVGRRVHLERALVVGDRLGGHWVTGHIDKTIQVVNLEREGGCLRVVFGPLNPKDSRLLHPKGSVAINGISLTVNEVYEDCFSVMIIPHTQSATLASEWKSGDLVNIEFDLLAKILARQQEVIKHA